MVARVTMDGRRPSHGTVLPDAGGPPHRPQPPLRPTGTIMGAGSGYPGYDSLMPKDATVG